MLRNYVFVFASVLASASATPIKGSFGLSTNANFVDVFGINFNYTWTFHQGDGFALYKTCDSLICTVDGGNAPEVTRIFDSLGFASAQSGGFQAFIGYEGPTPQHNGTVGGFVKFHLTQTDWRSTPVGDHGFSLPFEVSGVLMATDAAGHQFMNDILRATGTFHVEIVKSTSPDQLFFF